MSIDLLTNMSYPHIRRFDYESCFWVAWYIAICYKGGKAHTIKDHPLLSWHMRPISLAQSAKTEVMFRPGLFPAPGFGDESNDPTLRKIQVLFSAAFAALNQAMITDPRDPLWRTMNNMLTRELLSTAISGFKGSEERHDTSFLDELKPLSDEKDDLL